MQEYDVALKLLLRKSASVALRELTGVAVETWLDVELPKVQNLRVDLLGETGDGALIHVELQSTNEKAMPLRMAEYYLGIYRLLARFPRQLCLYIGKAPLQMQSELRCPDLSFRYAIVDIRSLDGDRLMESSDIGDNVIAILTRLRDYKDAIRSIVAKMAGLAAAERETAMRLLLTISGLRNLEEVVQQEVRKMPLYIDIMENKVLGPAYKRGLEEGEVKGELTILRRLVEKRFGPLPAWAEERLTAKSTTELEDLSLRVLDATTLDELLK
jgi:hypothetical protein